MSNTTRALPVVAAARDHTRPRAWAIASHKPATVAGSSWKNVRYSVESDGHLTEQRRLGPQLLDVAARLPAPGHHQHGLHQHLAPVMQREPLTT